MNSLWTHTHTQTHTHTTNTETCTDNIPFSRSTMCHDVALSFDPKSKLPRAALTVSDSMLVGALWLDYIYNEIINSTACKKDNYLLSELFSFASLNVLHTIKMSMAHAASFSAHLENMSGSAATLPCSRSAIWKPRHTLNWIGARSGLPNG